MTSDSPSTATDDVWTVQRVLEWTTGHLAKSGCETARLDAEILLAHARGCKRIELYTRFEEELTQAERSAMRDLVQRRAKLEPVAYLVGYREFFGLNFEVSPDVLVPRPETETLVVEALERLRAVPNPRLIDIGTGSGCIVISLLVNLPGATAIACDISEPALTIARKNAAAHGVSDRLEFRHSDVFAAIDETETVHLIVSNPPYIGTNERDQLPADVRDHEPDSALYAGPDGLSVIDRLIADAWKFVEPGGSILLEIAPEQEAAIQERIASETMYQNAETIRDLNGDARVVAFERHMK